MFNGLVNVHDFTVLARKLREEGLQAIAGKLMSANAGRVRKTWEHTSGTAAAHWWDIPEVERWWNTLITGDPDLDPYTYVTGRYLSGGADRRALSLGCGTGARELQWMKAGGLATLDAFDLSPERIAHAQRRARDERLAERLRFACRDVFAIEAPEGSYDVILVEGALHHFSPLRPIMERIRGWLRPGGWLVINEYIGPSRFQWTARQLEIVNGLLAILPEHLRRTPGGALKQRVYRPGRLSMYLNDPSEAAESANIVPLMRGMFNVAESRMYGGTVLQILLDDIAHNFLGDDELTREFLRLCFAVEDTVLRTGEVESDFGFFVCTK